MIKPPKLSSFSSQRGAVLLVSLIVMIFLSVLLSAAMMRSDVQMKEVDSKKRQQEAFYAAETGVDAAIYNLRQNSMWKPGRNGFGAMDNVAFQIPEGQNMKTIGFYTIDVADTAKFNTWESRIITSTGKDSEGKISRVLKVQVIVESPTRFLISTAGPLHIISGAEINADVLAKDIYFDIDSPPPNDEIQMKGDAFYTSTSTNDSNPAVKWQNGKKSLPAPSLTFAGVDLNRYELLAVNLRSSQQGYYYDGDLDINFNNLGALDSGIDPAKLKIIYAKGNIHVSGKYSKSILVVSAKNVLIDDSIYSGNASLPAQLGLFAHGDIIIPRSTAVAGDLTVEGFLLSDGNLPGSQGTFFADGDKGSKGNLNFKGSISVRGTGPQAVDLNVFKKRKYDFDNNFVNNRTIPYLPFIVNIVKWKETTP